MIHYKGTLIDLISDILDKEMQAGSWKDNLEEIFVLTKEVSKRIKDEQV